MRLERRLKRIEEHLDKGVPDLGNMSDDELALAISGDPSARACDISDEELEAMVREDK